MKYLQVHPKKRNHENKPPNYKQVLPARYGVGYIFVFFFIMCHMYTMYNHMMTWSSQGVFESGKYLRFLEMRERGFPTTKICTFHRMSTHHALFLVK